MPEFERERIFLTPERGVRKGWEKTFTAADLTAEDCAWLDAPLTFSGTASSGLNSRSSD